ncbi:MAG: hypothetical protein DDT32_02103 [Syntrophomonadaceae bacterium]|nr:hypothetical protein [Bacillota bacterium]
MLTTARVTPPVVVTPPVAPVTPPVAPVTPPVVRTEGSIAVTYAAIPPANVAIINGVADQSAAVIEIRAQGSDMTVNRLWLNFDSRLWLFADQIALFDGATSLASMALTPLPETAPGSWQVAFNNLNLTVPVGTTRTLTVRIGRPALTQNSGTVNIQGTSSIRATDRAGFSDSFVLAARALNFAATAVLTGELALSENVATPVERSVTGLSVTPGVLTPVELTRFNLRATRSAIELTQIASTLVLTGTGDLAHMVAAVELRDGDTVLASATPTGVGVATFDRIRINVARDATRTLSIWAQMNPIGTPAAGFTTRGAGISANVTTAGIVATTDVTFRPATITGSVTGRIGRMHQHAPTITLGTVSQSTTSAGVAGQTQGNYSIGMTITAPTGSDIFVGPIGSSKTDLGIAGTLASTVTVSGATSRGTALPTFDRILAGTSRTFTVAGLVPNLAVGTASVATHTNIATITAAGLVTRSVTGTIHSPFVAANVGGRFTLAGHPGTFIVSSVDAIAQTLTLVNLDGTAYTGGAFPVLGGPAAALGVYTITPTIAGFTGMRIANVTWTDTDHATAPVHVIQTWGLADFRTAPVHVSL